MYRNTPNFPSGRGHLPYLLGSTRYKKFLGEETFLFKVVSLSPTLMTKQTGLINFLDRVLVGEIEDLCNTRGMVFLKVNHRQTSLRNIQTPPKRC